MGLGGRVKGPGWACYGPGRACYRPRRACYGPSGRVMGPVGVLWAQAGVVVTGKSREQKRGHANECVECVDNIIMEDDLPSCYPNSKLPILDMKVWLDEGGNARYTHYEKPTASKQIISIRLAQSGSCKRSVHVNELVRRMLNISPSLSWAEYTTPVLEDYMRRMAQAGYREVDRHSVLKKAISIYKGKLQAYREDTVPLNRHTDYQKLEKLADKKMKKHSWVSKGGFLK